MASRNGYYSNGQIYRGINHYSQYSRNPRYPRPHQGDKEIARRANQIERGIIKTN